MFLSQSHKKETIMFQRVLSVCFVTVALTVWASAPTWAADIHQGKVVGVGAGKLTMEDMAGKNQHTHEVATNAAISCEGKACGLSDVKVDQNRGEEGGELNDKASCGERQLWVVRSDARDI
jgi:hypothetical protein